jgi:hypothetical protein
MARWVTYSIVDCPDGRFAVVAVSASGSVHRRGELLTLGEAEACVECLRRLIEACGAALVRREGDARDRSTLLRMTNSAARTPQIRTRPERD